MVQLAAENHLPSRHSPSPNTQTTTIECVLLQRAGVWLLHRYQLSRQTMSRAQWEEVALQQYGNVEVAAVGTALTAASLHQASC